jgi:hypothetical protein
LKSLEILWPQLLGPVIKQRKRLVSKLIIESIDSSNTIVEVLFTSAIFTVLPLYIPWVQPPPIRKYRMTFNGNSTSFIGSIVAYWRPEVSIVNIPNYAQPSNEYARGSFYNFNLTGPLADLFQYYSLVPIQTFRG